MPRRRQKDVSVEDIPLGQPSRGAPSEETLIQMARERGLFDQAKKQRAARPSPETKNLKKSRGISAGLPGRESDREDEEDDGDGSLSPAIERIADTAVWSFCLAMLHFTLDVLVQHQYAVRIVWRGVAARFGQAFAVFMLLLYVLHPHRSSPTLLPGLPLRFQHPLRQGIFLVTSLVSGCYLIYTTNEHGYLAVMKQAPPLGCLWVWSVIELDLVPAVLSLAGAGVFMRFGGFDFK